MTVAPRRNGAHAPDVAAASSAALSAASAARVVIGEVTTPDELDVMRSVMESIWGPEIVPPRNLLRGLAIGGNCLLVARRDDEPIGFALGWLGWNGGVHFHSHQVGVRAGIRGGGVGFALKMAQRALCLEHGIDEMRWTFDPMLLSNARFNLGRLGARVVGFLPHCYGDRRDAFNSGERTDRFEVSWALDRSPTSAPSALTDVEMLPVPSDYASLRLSDPTTAAAERERVRTRLVQAVADGDQVLGVVDEGYLIGSSPSNRSGVSS